MIYGGYKPQYAMIYGVPLISNTRGHFGISAFHAPESCSANLGGAPAVVYHMTMRTLLKRHHHTPLMSRMSNVVVITATLNI